jgi:excisionase family DNA binding protein
MPVTEKVTCSLLTVEEAAQQLALKASTIRAWLLMRRIGCVKLGRAVRIPRTEVERLIQEGAIPPRGRQR